MHVDNQVTAAPATESFVHDDQYGGPLPDGGPGLRAARADYSGRVADAETGRVDSWIWSVRLAKTRSAASSACRAGHVRVNGTRVKPAHPVRPGDEIRVRQEDWDRIVEVVRVISKRVSAPVAAECYVDHSPPPPPRERPIQVAIRDRGAGRPTKRDRRTLEKWLRGSPR
jgi:ribosome-associated heat shock protein Hsp15